MSPPTRAPCCSRPKRWSRCARERCGPVGWWQLLAQIDHCLAAGLPNDGRQFVALLPHQLPCMPPPSAGPTHKITTSAACPLTMPPSAAAPPTPRPKQEAQACLEQLSQAASLSGDLAVQLEGQMLAAALAAGEVKEGAKLPLLPPVVPPPPPVATVCTGTQTPAQAQTPAKPGLAAGFLGAAAKPGAAAARPAAAEGVPGLAPPTAADGSPARPAAAQQPAAAAARASAAAREGRPSRPSRPSRPGSAGDSRPEAAVDPLHQLVARTDANQGKEALVAVACRVWRLFEEAG